MVYDLLPDNLAFNEESYDQFQTRYSGFGKDLFACLDIHFPSFISNLRFFHYQNRQSDDVWAVFDNAVIQFGIQLDPDTPVIVLWDKNPDTQIEIGDWAEDAVGDAVRYIEEEFFAKGQSQSLPPA